MAGLDGAYHGRDARAVARHGACNGYKNMRNVTRPEVLAIIDTVVA